MYFHQQHCLQLYMVSNGLVAGWVAGNGLVAVLLAWSCFSACCLTENGLVTAWVAGNGINHHNSMGLEITGG